MCLSPVSSSASVNADVAYAFIVAVCCLFIGGILVVVSMRLTCKLVGPAITPKPNVPPKHTEVPAKLVNSVFEDSESLNCPPGRLLHEIDDPMLLSFTQPPGDVLSLVKQITVFNVGLETCEVKFDSCDGFSLGGHGSRTVWITIERQRVPNEIQYVTGMVTINGAQPIKKKFQIHMSAIGFRRVSWFDV